MPTPPTKDYFLLHVAGMLVHKVLIGCMTAHNCTLNMVESEIHLAFFSPESESDHYPDRSV
jgi:hypothetical protein